MSDLKELSNADLLAGIVAQARKDALQEAVDACQKQADEAKAEGLPPIAMGANFCRDVITALMEADT